MVDVVLLGHDRLAVDADDGQNVAAAWEADTDADICVGASVDRFTARQFALCTVVDVIDFEEPDGGTHDDSVAKGPATP